MKKPIINRITTNKLQGVAQGSARAIRELCQLLYAEIARNTVQEKGRLFGMKRTRPATVTYTTADIENRILNLLDCAIALDWYAVPTDKRGKLTPPRS